MYVLELRVISTCVVAFLVCAGSHVASAAEWHVAPGGTGNGASATPFGRIQDGVNAAQPGDVVSVRPGTYREAIRSIRNGKTGARITLRSTSGRGSVLVTFAGTALRVDHPYLTVSGFVFDGRYAAVDLIDVNGGGDYLIFRDSEVRRTSRDGIDLGDPEGVVIEGSLIHHTLNAAGGRTDAHGIVAGPVRRLTIRDTEIHTFSGDAVQLDPGRSAPGWGQVTIERCRFWLAPLPAAENGFPAGAVTGENAVDTKASATFPRSTIVIRDTSAWGFRNGLISNMAAFNLKENIDATLDGTTVWDSEIAFRLRGAESGASGAWVAIKNAVVHSTATAFRYENNIENLRIWNSTVGAGVARPFLAATSPASVLDVRNLLLLATALPREAPAPANLAVGSAAFTNVAAHNYTLSSRSPAIDRGVTIDAVSTDRQGIRRPQGSSYDVGAYERPAGSREIVLHAWRALMAGGWHVVSDIKAAGGARAAHADESATLTLKVPRHYFEMTFQADAMRPYRLWMRGKAERDLPSNDSVYVQFSGSVLADGAPVYRIDTTSAATVTLQECSTCSLSGWGWQDNGAGPLLGPVVYFATTGLQTVRVLTREDGFSIDQMVLSPARYLTQAPGRATGDTVILQETS
jgi:hypothetical protein